MSTAFILLSLVAGSLLALQAGANAQLSKAVDSPMAATTLQLGVGALLLLGVTVLTGTLSALPLLRRNPESALALGSDASATNRNVAEVPMAAVVSPRQPG